MTHSNFNPHQASYFGIITHEVMFCKSIEQGAKLLFAFITSLTYSCGYCFASDAHFAEKFDVDERTIRRWLESLEKQEFIYRDTKKKGMFWERKIYVFQKISTKGQKCPDREDENAPFDGAKMSEEREIPISEIPNNKESEFAKESDSPVADSLLSEDAKKIKELIVKSCILQKISIRPEILSRWMQKYEPVDIYSNFNLMLQKKEMPKNPESWMEAALKENWADVNTREIENREWFEKIFEKSPYPAIKITKKYFTDTHLQKDYHFKNPNFKSLVLASYPKIKELGFV